MASGAYNELFVAASWGDLTTFMTYTYVGKHWEDMSGLQPLGTFETLDFGVIAAVGRHWELRVQGTNLTNELGLTEANPVSGGSLQPVASSLRGRWRAVKSTSS